jgi:hypothetical protein
MFNHNDILLKQNMLVDELESSMGAISGRRAEIFLDAIISRAKRIISKTSNFMRDPGRLMVRDICIQLDIDRKLFCHVSNLIEEKGHHAILEDVSLLEELGMQAIHKDILNKIQSLRLQFFTETKRISLIDLAVKCGHLSIVQSLTEIFIDQGFEEDIRIPSKNNADHPYRPTFWLASIVTHYHAKENYVSIEKYLCEKLNIPNVVNINGKDTTREEYLLAVDKWKHTQNLRFMINTKSKELTYIFSLPRYRRHEFLNEIETFDQSKLKKIN